MHPSALRAGKRFFQLYGESAASILDLGSMDINGSLRTVAPSGSTYTGVDIEPGHGADVVCPPGERLPFPDSTFDLVVSSSCFEHDQTFWVTALEAMRVLKPGGYFYFNSPSNGAYHSYPYDNWRFYPDCGLALSKWFNASGIPSSLVESGILPASDQWNDFFAVFSKGVATPPRSFVSSAFPGAINVRISEGDPATKTEWWTIIDPGMQDQLEQTERQLSEARALIDRIQQSRSWRVTAPFRQIKNWLAKTVTRNTIGHR